VSATVAADDAVPSVPLSGRIEDGRHRFWLRVYYEDTDAAGIVYYANYLKYAERARTEMLRLIGVVQSHVRDSEGVVFAVSGCRIDYRRPALLDDLLEVSSRLTSLGGASLAVEQRIHRDGEDVAVLDVRVACLSAGDGRPARIPRPVRAALAPYRPSLEQV
jgi:acyl-CoA thioester hydrolase